MRLASNAGAILVAVRHFQSAKGENGEAHTVGTYTYRYWYTVGKATKRLYFQTWVIPVSLVEAWLKCLLTLRYSTLLDLALGTPGWHRDLDNVVLPVPVPSTVLVYS